MTFPTITNLPAAPSRDQTPENFASTADTFVAALPTLVTEINTSGSYIDTKNATIGNSFQGNYGAGTTYALGDSVLYTDSKFYVSLQNSNTGNAPDVATAFWEEILGAVPQTGGAGSVSLVASGAISDGQLVAINNDGTVSALEGSGSITTFNGASVTRLAAVYDTNSNKVVIAYRDGANSGRGTAIVGTVSGTSITFGTPLNFNSLDANDIAIAFDTTANKVIISYRDGSNSDHGTTVVGDVSGTSISFGTPVVHNAGRSETHVVAYDSVNDKVIVAYRDVPNSNSGTAIVGTVSGTSISFGTEVAWTTNTNFLVGAFDSNAGSILIAYRDVGGGDVGGSVVGTVSGTSISFGTPVVFNSAGTTPGSVTFDPNTNKLLVTYWDFGGSSNAEAVVATISGTSVSYGTLAAFNTGTTSGFSAAYNSSDNKIYVSYEDTSNSNYQTIIPATISGTSVTFGSEVVLAEVNTANSATVYDPDQNKLIVAFDDQTNVEGRARVYNTSSNLTEWIGIATSAVSDAATGTFTTVGGVNTSQTGLTVGAKYYINNSAELTTTTTSGREVGRAISATNLLLTYGSIS